MKRLVCALLAMLLVLAMAPALAESQVPSDFVTLTWYLPAPIANMASEESVEAFVADYLKDKLNCAIDFVFLDQANYANKIRLMSAAGEEFDMFMIGNGFVDTKTGVAQGYCLPITDLLNTYGQDIIASNDDRAWPAATFGGEIMFIPLEVPFARGRSFVFQADLFDKYKEQLGMNYDEMHTLASLEPYLELIKQNEPDLIPIYSITDATELLSESIFDPATCELTPGISYVEATGELVYTRDVPFYRDLARTWADYYQKGYVARDLVVRTEVITEKKSGRYAVVLDTGEYSQDGSKATGMLGFRCYESLISYKSIQTGSLQSGTAISANSRNAQRAMMFLNLMWADPFLSNTLAFGLEGQDYKVISGDPRVPDENLYIEADSGEDQTWAIWHTWTGPLWDQWDSNWNRVAALELMQYNNDNSPVSGSFGFTFDPEPVKSEVAAVATVAAEYEPVIAAGTSQDVDATFDQYLAAELKAGLETIKDEVQRQLDAWRAESAK